MSEDKLPYSKRKQVGRRYKEKPVKKKDKTPEAALQRFLDDLLKVKKLRNFRIPDNFWSFLFATTKFNMGLRRQFAGIFGGWPDNMVFLPLTDKYLIALPIELKTQKGRLHGKQVTMGFDMNYTVARDSEAILAAVEQFENDCATYKEKLQ